MLGAYFAEPPSPFHAQKIPADLSLADAMTSFLWPGSPHMRRSVCIVHPSSPALVGSPSLAVVELSPPISSCEIGCDATLPYSQICGDLVQHLSPLRRRSTPEESRLLLSLIQPRVPMGLNETTDTRTKISKASGKHIGLKIRRFGRLTKLTRANPNFMHWTCSLTRGACPSFAVPPGSAFATVLAVTELVYSSMVIRKPFSLTYSELPCHLLEQWRRSSCRSSRRLYCDRYYSAIQAHDWTQCPSSYGLGRFWPTC